MNTSTKMPRLLLVGLLVLLTGLVSAITVTAQFSYDEGTSGDLPGSVGAAPFHTIGVGTNTWTGSIGPTAPPGQDNWKVVIPSGVRLDSVKWSGPASNGGASYDGFFQMNGSTQNHNGAIQGYVVTGGSGTWKNITDATLGVGVPGVDTMQCVVSTSFAISARNWTVRIYASSTGGGGGVAPSVTASPGSSTVCAGATASFTAAASGTPAPTVQWQKKPSGGSFANIGGATSTTYSFTAAVGDNGSQYQAVFTNSEGTATSSPATLTVNTAPTVTMNPSNQTVCLGNNLSMSAVASGSPAPSVQWQVSTGGAYSDIPGATSTTYSAPVNAGMDGNMYRARFTNSCGSNVATSAATLTVKTPTLNVGLSPQLIITSGGTMTAVSATVQVIDGCGAESWVLQSVTSSDADAGTFPGDQANDIQNATLGSNDTQFDLRAEVTPPNPDRTYLVTYRLTNGTYTTDVTEPVIVPKGIGTLLPGGTNDCFAGLGPIPTMTGATVDIPFEVYPSFPAASGSTTTVRLTVYDTKGKVVYGLINDVPTGDGTHSATWDGTNNAGLNPGTQQPAGYYLVLLEACADYRTVAVLLKQ